MKKILLALFLISAAMNTNAGRSAPTKIVHVIVKAEYVEIWTESQNGDCGNTQGWHLMNSHPNFDALYSGLLATRASDKRADIVGTGNCNGSYEIISWSYVAM